VNRDAALICVVACLRSSTVGLVGVVTAAGYAALAMSDRVLVLVAVAFCGMVNGMGRDRGPASSIEQAILPETTTPERRTMMLAWYNLALDAGHAIGALAGAIPTLLVRGLQIDTVRAHQIALFICAGVVVLGVVPYFGLTPAIEVAGPSPSSPNAV
jgi:hypothetical protein